jgi:hypothetical protein
MDTLWDHLCTCTGHSGVKKAHDWTVDQMSDLFRTTHKFRCGDIELAVYLANAASPVPLVLDLHITHERWESNFDPSFNGHLHYPNDLDRSLNEAAADKIRSYRADYNNRPSNGISFMPTIASTSGRIHRELTVFLQLQQFRLRNLPVSSSTTTALRSPNSSNIRLAIFSSRLQHYGLS